MHLNIGSPPAAEHRPRRLRGFPAMRRMFREISLSADQLVHPLFIRAGRGIEQPIASLPGHAQYSVDRVGRELDGVAELGIPAVLLFGIPDEKDSSGSAAWDAGGPVPRAIDEIRRRHPGLVVIADVCLCEYTSHGHCGVVDPVTHGVVNDETLALLARAAVTYADAGAHVVAPSAMMDGQVAAIRNALDEYGHDGVAVLSYAAKFASAFYGPFREAAGSTPAFGDRRGYQMDVANAREAMRELRLDAEQGADAIMVKPAGTSLDVIRAARDRFDLPVAAYQVSGEYAMIRAAADRGWLDERAAAIESLTAIRRAGADIIVTYFARSAAAWLRDDS